MDRKKLHWSAKAGIATAAVVFLLLLFRLATNDTLFTRPAPTVRTGPEKTVRFPDGGKLEIFGTSVGERVVEISPAETGLLASFSSRGSSHYTLDGEHRGLDVIRETQKNKVLRCRARSGSSPALLMEIRLTATNGAPEQLPFYASNRRDVFPDRRLTGKGFYHSSFRPKDESVESLSAAMTACNLPLLIQQNDPQSGWIDLTGPFLFHEDWKDRYMVVLTAWRRDLPTLDFRAIRADGQVVEFSLANPDLKTKPAVIACKPLPLVHSGVGYSVTVKNVERFSTPGEHPFAALDMEVVINGKPRKENINDPMRFTDGNPQAEDEWGNTVSFQSHTIRKKLRHYGAFLPASSTRMSVSLNIQRTWNYPQTADSGFPILEGVVRSDGNSVDFTLLPDAARFGIHEPPPGKIETLDADSPWSDGLAPGWKKLVFKYSGEFSKDRLPFIETRIGKFEKSHSLIFPEGSTESGGVIPQQEGFDTGTSEDHIEIKRSPYWLGSPEMLRPGARFRIAIHGAFPDEVVKFEVELPSLVQPR